MSCGVICDRCGRIAGVNGLDKPLPMTEVFLNKKFPSHFGDGDYHLCEDCMRVFEEEFLENRAEVPLFVKGE